MKLNRLGNVAHTVLDIALADMQRANESIFAVEKELPEDSLERQHLYMCRVALSKAISELYNNKKKAGNVWGEFGKDPILDGKERKS